MATSCLARPGEPVTVPWLSQADSLVALLETAHGLAVGEIAVAELGISPRAGVDGEPRDTVTLDGTGAFVPVPTPVAEEWRMRAALGRVCQMAGAMETVQRLCVEHVQDRIQFGRPLSRFQAVQSLVTQVACETALTRAAVGRAVELVARLGITEPRAQFAVAAAKACAGTSAGRVVRDAHQVHGAIGTTFEHPLQRFTRPLLQWRADGGSTNEWEAYLERFAVERGPDAVWDALTA